MKSVQRRISPPEHRFTLGAGQQCGAREMINSGERNMEQPSQKWSREDISGTIFSKLKKNMCGEGSRIPGTT
jgi:hypothetical protein